MAGQLPVPCTESEWLALKWRSQTLREGLLDQKLGLLAKWMLKTPRMEREREREKESETERKEEAYCESVKLVNKYMCL